MAAIAVEGADLVVRLSALEKIGSLHGNLRAPLRAVRSVTVEQNPWGLVRGVRRTGAGLPGVISLGVRRLDGRKDFNVVYGNRPVLRIELDAQSRFARLLVRVASPELAVAVIAPGAG